MPKSYLFRCALIFLSCSSINLAYAYSESTKNDLLQTYRDEIKQSESNASQAVLDNLKAHADADPNNSSKQESAVPETSAATPIPRSNTDKAFAPSDNKPADSTQSSNKNPWLKPSPWAKPPPNPWVESAKVNPYSNAPIPGPTPSINSAVPGPPNIFAPSRPTPNTNQTRPHANL